MKSAKATENRVQEVSEITRNLKIMAKELMVPVIACAQLSRGTEVKGKSHKPALSDLRESGSIEQDADIVLFLYRDEYYKDISGIKGEADSVDSANIAEVIVAKNRHGSVGNVKMGWNGQFTKFMSLDTRFDNDAK
jgi:replicative DNA helicase